MPNKPIWTPCDCGEFFCNIHHVHAHECECPPVDEWKYSPYEVIMKPKSNQSRQSEFKARQKKAGLIRVEVWIPKSKKAEFNKLVAKLNGN